MSVRRRRNWAYWSSHWAKGVFFAVAMHKSLADVSIRRYLYRPMPTTPFFPDWRASLAPLGSHTALAFAQVRSYTLCQLETCLGPWLPTALFPKAADKENSR